MKMKKLTAAEIVSMGKLSLEVPCFYSDSKNSSEEKLNASVETSSGNLVISSGNVSFEVKLDQASQLTKFMNDFYPITKEPKEKKPRKKRQTKAEKLSNQVKYEAPEGESLAM